AFPPLWILAISIGQYEKSEALTQSVLFKKDPRTTDFDKKSYESLLSYL
ncbi:MAG: hypothetical protein ACI959_001764, partial [Limisphaerales bacterium]